MNAVNKLLVLAFQCFRRTDIGLYHAFFNEFMRIQTLRHQNTINRAVFLQQNFALRQIQFKRLAVVATAGHALVSCVKRLKHVLHQGLGLFIRLAIDGCLIAWISKIGMVAHQNAMERMFCLTAFRIKMHLDGKSRAVFTFA